MGGWLNRLRAKVRGESVYLTADGRIMISACVFVFALVFTCVRFFLRAGTWRIVSM